MAWNNNIKILIKKNIYNTKNNIPLIITPHLANLLKYIFIDKKPRLNPMGIIKNITSKGSHSNLWYDVVLKKWFNIRKNITRAILKETIPSIFPIFLSKDLFFMQLHRPYILVLLSYMNIDFSQLIEI